MMIFINTSNYIIFVLDFLQFNSETMKWEGNPCNDPTVQVMTFTCLLHKFYCYCMFVAGLHWIPEVVS